MKNLLMICLAVGAFAFAGCASDDVNPTAPDANLPADVPVGDDQFPVNEDMPGVFTEFSLKRSADADLVDTAAGAGLSTLVAAIQAAGLEDTFRGEGPFTVFAPTNEAFENLPEGLLDALLLPENQGKLQEILALHVIAGAAVESRDLRFFQRVESFGGEILKIFRFFRLVIVNGVPVELADVRATNGVAHVIGEVLIPEGFTLEDPAEPELDLVDTAINAGLSTLATAVTEAGLVDALRGEGPFTVFAPSNEAFERLPHGLLEELLLPENNELLQDLLLYHVVNGAAVFSGDLDRFQRVEMFNGQKTFVYKFGEHIYVNFSKVQIKDVAATNGVAHVISRVLIPPHFYGQLKSLPEKAPELELPVEDFARNR